MSPEANPGGKRPAAVGKQALDKSLSLRVLNHSLEVEVQKLLLFCRRFSFVPVRSPSGRWGKLT